jgi:hypothetical protein
MLVRNDADDGDNTQTDVSRAGSMLPPRTWAQGR